MAFKFWRQRSVRHLKVRTLKVKLAMVPLTVNHKLISRGLGSKLTMQSLQKQMLVINFVC